MLVCQTLKYGRYRFAERVVLVIGRMRSGTLVFRLLESVPGNVEFGQIFAEATTDLEFKLCRFSLRR